MPTAKKRVTKSPKIAPNNVTELPITELRKRITKVASLLTQIEQALPNLIEFSDEERRVSNGRLRDEEPKAMYGILDAADACPEAFIALAKRDRGKDDLIFETEPAREDLQRREVLLPLLKQLEPLTQKINDTVLFLGGRAREITKPAYAIAMVAAEDNRALRAKLQPAVKFFSGLTQRSVQSRKKNSK